RVTATHDIHTPSLHDALPILSSMMNSPSITGTRQKRRSPSLRAVCQPSPKKRGPELSGMCWADSTPLKQAEPGLVSTHCPTRFLDRKSTRLNSSHVKISYAVF